MEIVITQEMFFILTFAIFLAIKFGMFFKRKRKLGNLLIETPSGIKNSDLPFQFLMLGILGILYYFVYTNEILSESNMLFLSSLVGIYFAYILYAAVIAISKKGLYENGVSSLVGILYYSEIDDFQVANRSKNKGRAIKFKKIPKFLKGFFDPIHFMFITGDSEVEISKLLREKCDSIKRRQMEKQLKRNKKKKK